MFCPKKPAPSRKRKTVISARTTIATMALPLKKYLMISSGVRPRMRKRLRLSSASPMDAVRAEEWRRRGSWRDAGGGRWRWRTAERGRASGRAGTSVGTGNAARAPLEEGARCNTVLSGLPRSQSYFSGTKPTWRRSPGPFGLRVKSTKAFASPAGSPFV